MEQEFKIGQTFKSRGKHPRLCTVVDILKTYNSKNELVKIEYVEHHDFMGQTVSSRVCGTTIKMGLANMEGSNA